MEVDNDRDEVLKSIARDIAQAPSCSKPWSERVILGIWAVREFYLSCNCFGAHVVHRSNTSHYVIAIFKDFPWPISDLTSSMQGDSLDTRASRSIYCNRRLWDPWDSAFFAMHVREIMLFSHGPSTGLVPCIGVSASSSMESSLTIRSNS